LASGNSMHINYLLKYNENQEIPHRTIPKLNMKTVERDKIDTPNTHILDRVVPLRSETKK
jgi:hypothetical protein